MNKEIIENHKRYIERLKLYKSYGYDTVKSRQFFLKEALPLHGEILEVGTGKGHISLVLAKAGYYFISVDTSREEQRFAELNVKYYKLKDKVQFKIDDAEHLSFKDKSFDIVICACLMHHLDKPLKAVDEFFRVLKPRGKIILSDFSKGGLDLIAKIHADEGRIHTATIEGLSKIEDYLKKRNINFKKTQDKFHEVILIQT